MDDLAMQSKSYYWEVSDMGWKRAHNWHLSLTRFKYLDGRFVGTFQLWVGPLCINRWVKVAP